MLSLIGIPCFPVFMGKLYVFGSVTDKGLYWFATIGALNAAVAAFYYNASPESDADRRWKWHYDPTAGSFPQSSIGGLPTSCSSFSGIPSIPGLLPRSTVRWNLNLIRSIRSYISP